MSRRNRGLKASERRHAPRRRTSLRERWRKWRSSDLPVGLCLAWAVQDVREDHPVAAGLAALAVAAACVWCAVTAWMEAVHGG